MSSFLARNRRALSALLAIYWIAIFIGTHIPQVPQGMEGVSDKYLHFGAYAGLSVLLALAVFARGWLSARIYPLLFGVVAAYGAIDELLQIPVGRDCSFWDWCADVTGALLGLGCVAAAVVLFDRARSADQAQ